MPEANRSGPRLLGLFANPGAVESVLDMMAGSYKWLL